MEKIIQHTIIGSNNDFTNKFMVKTICKLNVKNLILIKEYLMELNNKR